MAKEAVVTVQWPGKVTGKLERFHRAVADGTSDDAIREALEKILTDRDGETLVRVPVKRRKAAA
jgi:hypothetical protein